MISKTIGGSTFFSDIIKDLKKNSNKPQHYNDGDLQYVASFSLDMEIVYRTKEELFSQTVNDAFTLHNYPVISNGNQYDVTRSGIIDALLGSDPVAASETTPLGHIYSGGSRIAGTDEPQRFFVSYLGPQPVPMALHSSYEFGFGNPLPNAVSAIGGLGPLIVNNLKYGIQNVYSSGVPAGAPAIGQPAPQYLPYLVQRSNATYTAMAARGNNVGKTSLALCRNHDIILVIVQPDGAATGISLDSLRDKLAGVAVSDAVFMDGSNSAMLVFNGTYMISQDSDKNETNTVGFAIK